MNVVLTADISSPANSTRCDGDLNDIHCVNELVNTTKTISATIALIVSSIFILYVIIHVLLTIRWDILFRNFSGDSLRTRIQKFFNFRQYNNRIVLVNNPILRLLFILQITCFMGLPQYYLETFRLNKSMEVCILQFVIVNYFEGAKVIWTLFIAVWLFWIVVLYVAIRSMLLVYLVHLI